MTDQELMRLAAKAAGITVTPWPEEDPVGVRDTATGHLWNPLTDGDAALRLAVALQFHVSCAPYATVTGLGVVVGVKDEDPLKATCRAIVMAAASVGKAMP